MGNNLQTNLSSATLHAMLDYLQEEIQMAETVDDINAIFTMLKSMFTEPATINTVRGLPHIRAEVRNMSSNSPYNVATNVPHSLVSTFYDLSDKMNFLQTRDPEMFNNASKALNWLANGEVEAK
jgi:hypothetical protein